MANTEQKNATNNKINFVHQFEILLYCNRRFIENIENANIYLCECPSRSFVSRTEHEIDTNFIPVHKESISSTCIEGLTKSYLALQRKLKSPGIRVLVDMITEHVCKYIFQENCYNEAQLNYILNKIIKESTAIDVDQIYSSKHEKISQPMKLFNLLFLYILTLLKYK